MAVPGETPELLGSCSRPPSMRISQPSKSCCCLVQSLKRETLAMLGRASPRNPKCVISKSSFREESLLVACRLVHSSASARDMPLPSSVTLIMPTPPRRISTRTNLAPASRLFSTSSFTTEAGRSTTSPAATWLARVGDMTWMDGMAMTDWKRLFQKAEP